jgi:lipopolysaccharide export system ATP-binding protein
MVNKLEVDGISLQFGERRILSDIYLKCETGSITGLLGRNGEGKTCLMNIIYGTLKAQSKSVRFNNISNYDAFKRADLLTYLPQFNFIPLHLTLNKIFRDFNLLFSEFESYFPEFQNTGKTRIKNLSGGERRLIEVYVIIKSRSQFSMLDEPFPHLMPLQVEKIKELLNREKLNKGFLITDHLYKQFIEICDSIYVLTEGETHLTKTIEDIERFGYAKL